MIIQGFGLFLGLCIMKVLIRYIGVYGIFWLFRGNSSFDFDFRGGIQVSEVKWFGFGLVEVYC